LSSGLFFDPGLNGIWAYNNVFAINQLGPRAGLAVFKTFILAAATRILVTSGGVVVVLLQSLLGYTWMGLAMEGMKLCAALLIDPKIPQMFIKSFSALIKALSISMRMAR
jgi:hypothetical protein